jgi:predicted HAD superfamily Cof-like phosphohydrolase
LAYKKGQKVFIHSIKKPGKYVGDEEGKLSIYYPEKVNGKVEWKKGLFEANDVSLYRPRRRKFKYKKYNPNEMYYMTREFQVKFGHPYSDKPRQLSKEEVADRYKWMLEELNEFKEAKTLEDQVDALTDLLYFTFGTFNMAGVKPFNIFKIVHNANMAKLWEDRKPHYGEDGKVIKPKGWKPPEPLIKKEIERQAATK